jgi:3',5'-cyclic-AMP phosphodiesterase
MLLAHLSDTHLATGVLAGRPAGRFHQALARVRALDPRPDCVVLTGDLADHGEPAEYEAALALLGGLDIPVHAVPGNHDHAPRMLQALAGAGYARAAADEPERCYYRVDHPGLRLLCCDSSVPGRHDGELGPTQLAWLDRELGRDPEVPAILAMHHHPVPSGITFMDTIMLSDADDLAAVLRAHPPLTRATSTGPARPCSPAPWSPPPPAPTSRSTSTSAPPAPGPRRRAARDPAPPPPGRDRGHPPGSGGALGAAAGVTR